jgi:hypothetical protein
MTTVAPHFEGMIFNYPDFSNFRVIAKWICHNYRMWRYCIDWVHVEVSNYRSIHSWTSFLVVIFVSFRDSWERFWNQPTLDFLGQWILMLTWVHCI